MSASEEKTLVVENGHYRVQLSNGMAAYLVPEEGREPDQYTPEMSRRARGVEIWAALKSLGDESPSRENSESAVALSIPGVSTDTTVNRLASNLDTIRQWRLEGSASETVSHANDTTPIVR